MTLLQVLKLPKPRSLAGANVRPAPAPTKAEAGDLGKEINEAARFAATLGDDEAKRELAQALKNIQEQSTAAMKLGDQTERDKQIKKAMDAVKAARNKAVEKVKAKLASATSGGNAHDAKGNDGKAGAASKPDAKPDAKKDAEEKDGKAKLKGTLITDKGKLGAGAGVESELEQKTKKGDVVSCNASFEGKAWVETNPVPYSEPPEMQATFHLVVGAKSGAGAKRERASGTGGSVKVSASVELELSYKRKMTAEESKRYLDAVKSGGDGGWEELRALQLAVKGSMTEARALVARLGGKQREVNEGDEIEQTLSSSIGGDADVSHKRGAFGIGLSVGGSVSGSLSRTIKFDDGQYWITLRAASGKAAKGGAGFSLEGVGMNVTRDGESHESQAVTFVIDPKKPALKPLLEKVMAAATIAQMLDLRAKNPSVASFDVKTKGSSDGASTGASLFGVGLTGSAHGFGSETEIDGPDGKTKIYAGGNEMGSSAMVGDKPLGAASKTDQFSGGAGADNKGFGETSTTDRHGNLVAGLGALYDKAKKSPLTTAKNLYEGKEELSKDESHQEGSALTDDSYATLARRAQGGKNQWMKYWAGDMSAYFDWEKSFAKVRAAGEDRQKIAKAIAEYERGTGTGRHATVEAAIAGTAIVFEFPPTLGSKKAFYDKLIVNDPIPDALGAGAPSEVLKKLEELSRQLEGFRDDMSKSKEEFGDPARYQNMAARINRRRDDLLAAMKPVKAKIKAADDQAKGINQFTPAEPNQSKVDPAKEHERMEGIARHINELKRDIGEAYAEEQRVFARWEVDLKGFTVFGVSISNADVMTLIKHENKLRGLYPAWDQRREDLRKLLGEAGPGFSAAEADALRPDRLRYRALRAKGPQAGWNKDDGV
jgi:hypothetical protein